jgi:hypothetical protein
MMGQKQLKQARKAAEKTTKAMAFELAKAQMMEIANAPFKIRWAYCKAILFPKKLKVSAKEKEKLQNNAYGGFLTKTSTGGLGQSDPNYDVKSTL